MPVGRGETNLIATRAASHGIGGASNGGGEYRLPIQKQPGADTIPLTVAMRPRQGARKVSLWLDGRRLDGESPAVETDLSQDRELVVRYRW